MRPPGPRSGVLATLRFFVDPVRFFEAGRRRYGPLFVVRYPGMPPEVYLTTAELAEQAYALDADGGRAGVVRGRFMDPLVGEHSLLTLDGEPWRRHRKLLSPPLHGRAIARYREQIAEIAAAEIGRWPLGEPFALRDRMQNITLEVILRLVFGIQDAGRLARLRVLLPRLIDHGAANTLIMLPHGLRDRLLASRRLRRVPWLTSTKFVIVRDAVDAILFDEIARRRARPDAEATDVLSLLLAARDAGGEPMSDQELRDELITMLEAGHETTATGLAWAFERLLRTPAVLARLREELAAGEEGYLDAVVKEALRSRPVVYEAPRLVDKAVTIGSYEIPAGWYASPLISMIHQDPEVFPEPAEFRPERFLGEGAARANKGWMPFGGGRRYCAGAQLALLEMRVVIREVLGRVELAAVDAAPERPRLKHVTLVPDGLGRVVARARHEVPAG